MSGKLRFLYDRATASFWFLPLLMAAAAVFLFFVTLGVDNALKFKFLDDYGPPFSISSDGARQLLSTIAGALITVASLVFSMTLVALTLAAGNIGARLLLRYMRNRTIKVTLGLFLASFVYALMGLSAIGDDAETVPRLTVVCSMVFAIISFMWLAYAFHDLAETIQVDRAIGRAAAALNEAIRALTTQDTLFERSGPDQKTGPSHAAFTVPAAASNYIQSIDKKALFETAAGHDITIAVRARPGSFLMEGELLAEIYEQRGTPDNADRAAIIRAVCDAVVLGPVRTDSDDPFFGMRLLNEIAARALSPAMNDLYTAMVCIDHMADAVRLTLNGALPQGRAFDDDGVLRLDLAPYEFEHLMAQAYDDLRRNATPHPTVAIRLVDRLCRLATFTEIAEERDVIAHHATLMMTQARELATNDRDRRLIEESLSLKADY